MKLRLENNNFGMAAQGSAGRREGGRSGSTRTHVQLEAPVFIARQRQELRGGQGHAGRSGVSGHGQLAADAIDQHGQAHAGGAAIVKQLVQHGADGAARVQHVIEQKDVAAVHFKGQARLAAAAQAPAVIEIGRASCRERV